MKYAIAMIAAVLLGLGANALGAEKVEVRHVAVHLFLTPSGEFSQDVTALPTFSSWNHRPTSDVGPANEEFHAYLIKVHLAAKHALYSKGTLGIVKVQSAKTGRRL